MKYNSKNEYGKDNSNLLNGWAPSNSPSRSHSCRPTVLAPKNNTNFQNVTVTVVSRISIGFYADQDPGEKFPS